MNTIPLKKYMLRALPLILLAQLLGAGSALGSTTSQPLFYNEPNTAVTDTGAFTNLDVQDNAFQTLSGDPGTKPDPVGVSEPLASVNGMPIFETLQECVYYFVAQNCSNVPRRDQAACNQAQLDFCEQLIIQYMTATPIRR